MNKMRYLRIGVAAGVIALVAAGTALHIPIGTLCALCPVGFAEIVAAGGGVPWALLPGVIVLLAAVFALGRVFCSWACPTSLLRNVFGGRAPRGLTGRTGVCVGCSTSCGELDTADAQQGEARGAGDAADGPNAANPNGDREHSNLKAQGIVLAALLAVSLIVHFPVFCLICPIGLVFGSLFAVSRLFVTWQPGWELIVFPLMLLAEVFLLRRWCAAICPLGFFFGVLASARKRLPFLPGPHVRKDRCIHDQGCNVCATVCPENISAATADARDLEDCTLCLDCTEHCPTRAIPCRNRR